MTRYLLSPASAATLSRRGALCLLLILCSIAPLDGLSAQRTLAASNSPSLQAEGIMFDLAARQPCVVRGFEVDLARGVTADLEILATRNPESHAAQVANPAAWERLASYSAVRAGSAIPLPLDLQIELQTGETRGIYIRRTDGGEVMYAGSSRPPASVVEADAFLEMTNGVALVSAFGATFSPREFGGEVRYRPLLRVPEDHATIQGAIDAAITQGAVLVAPGTYSGGIDMRAKGLLLSGRLGLPRPILDAGGTTPVVMADPARTSLHLDSLILQGGRGSLPGQGGGLTVGNFCQVRNLWIRDCEGGIGAAGGLQCTSGAFTVEVDPASFQTAPVAPGPAACPAGLELSMRPAALVCGPASFAPVRAGPASWLRVDAGG